MKYSIRDSVTRNVISYNGEGFEEVRRELVEEVNIQIYRNQERAGEIACSPWNVKEAVIGFLYMKGFISNFEEVKEVRFSEEGNVYVVTENIIPETKEEADFENLKVSVDEIIKLAGMLENGSKLFHRTGGVHCAALARNGEFIVYKEDVSRHVAVDKVVGTCLEQKIPMKNGVLVFSGRVPAEIMQKVAAMGCGMIIARSAPTDYACRMAEKVGITLVAFARDNKFNIYTHPEKVYSVV